jgi:lysophospholipase L1-like esterase
MTRAKEGPLKLILINAAVFLIMWGILEGAAWAYYEKRLKHTLDYSLAERFEDQPEIFDGDDVDAQGRRVIVSSRLPTRYYTKDTDRQNNAILADKPARGARIFVYGGSSTAGSPWGPWASFARFLEDQLRAMALPGVELEVMNFGVSSIGSTRLAALVEWTIEDSPDLIIIYQGHNENCESLAPATPVTWLSAFERRSMLFRVLRLTFAPHPALPPEPFAAPACDDPAVLSPDDKDRLTARYSQNIDRILESARRTGASVVLMSQVSNMFVPPFASTGQGAAARSFRSGISALRRGNDDKAERLLADAVDLDEQPRRFRSDYGEILRQRADPKRNIFFIDSEEHIRKQAVHGLLGGRFIIDLMHPNLTTQKFLAESLMTLFFLPTRWKAELFDYRRYDHNLIWRWRPTTSQYFMACRRYFEGVVSEKTGEVDPRACLTAARADLAEAKELESQRRARRLWEFLWVYGHDKKDPKALAEAEKILANPIVWNHAEAMAR